MGSCPQCGKEVPEGKKFCNSSCSAKYNNSRRVRKPWTEEQKGKFQNRGKQVCKYCGKETGYVVISSRIPEGVCKDCKCFAQKMPTFSKLGFNTGSLRERNEQLSSLVEDLHTEGRYITEICKELGLHDVTVRKILKSRNLRLYTPSEVQTICAKSRKGSFPTEHRYKTGMHTSWEGKKFYYRSSYELEFARSLDDQRIPYEMEPFRILYWDSEKERERVAIPDFYLPETNELVEIKSSWTYNKQNMEDRFKAFREEGYKPVLILDKMRQ